MRKLKLSFLLTVFFFAAAPLYSLAQTGSWNALGGNFPFIASAASVTLATDTSGNVYAAGWFDNGSSPAYVRYVAKWDKATNTWSELGGRNSMSGPNNTIFSVATDITGNVYVGNSVGAEYSYHDYVAKWDKATNSWSELGGTNSCPANNWIFSVATDLDENVYAGG